MSIGFLCQIYDLSKIMEENSRCTISKQEISVMAFFYKLYIYFPHLRKLKSIQRLKRQCHEIFGFFGVVPCSLVSNSNIGDVRLG